MTKPSTHFHRKLIRTGGEFECRMSHLLQALPAWNDDSGYYFRSKKSNERHSPDNPYRKRDKRLNA